MTAQMAANRPQYPSIASLRRPDGTFPPLRGASDDPGPAPAPSPPAPAPPAPAPPEPGPPEPKPEDDPQVFDKAYVSKLREEAAANRKRAQEAETRLKAIDDRDKTEAQKAAERAKAAEDRAAELERRDVAREAGLPAEWADRLRGDTRDALEADAKALAASFPTPSPAGWDGGPRGGGAPPALPDDATALQRLAHAYGDTPPK